MKQTITQFNINNSLHLMEDCEVKLSENFTPFDRFSGFTFTPILMSHDAPHHGEMHPDGDEIIYLFSGKIEVSLELDEKTIILLGAGEGMVIPKGVWHKVHVLEPANGVTLSPGPGFEYRELG